MAMIESFRSAFSYSTRDWYAVVGLINLLYGMSGPIMYASTGKIWTAVAGFVFLNIGFVLLVVERPSERSGQNE